MVDKSHQDDLDWNTLSNPVPLDLIDPEFPAHPPQTEPSMDSLPGAISEILPREESEALVQAHDATLEMPARGRAAGGSGGEGALSGSTWQEPRRDDSQEDDFSRLRSNMEAEAEAEKKAKQEAEKEEASQRERLEQWMANARARLLKADADLAGPSARIRIRKDHSPSLHRLVEMQKTIFVEGDATLAQSPNGTLASEAPRQAAKPPLDPMATISVPADQFLTLDAPAQPTPRKQALARQAAQQVTALQASQQKAAARQAKEQTAQARADAQAAQAEQSIQSGQPYPSGEIRMDQISAPLTREQALTRKVAQLRKVAEDSAERAPIALSDGLPERSALHFAIAAVVIIAIGVLGLGLFAATQAGLFDGLENRVPFLRPKMSAQELNKLRRPATPSAPEAPARPANNAAAAKPSVVPVAHPVPSGQVATALNASVPAKTAVKPPPKARAKKAAGDADEIPAYAKARPKSSNLAEIILRSSVQAATNVDADNFQEMYNRYALGFPGLSGEVVVGLTVDPGGRVLEGSIISSSTGVEAFDQELLRKVLDWRLRAFPDSRPKFITVPFLFPLQGR